MAALRPLPIDKLPAAAQDFPRTGFAVQGVADAAAGWGREAKIGVHCIHGTGVRRMRIVLELDTDVARALQQPPASGPSSAPAAELQRLAVQRGLRLQPMHPRAADPGLARYFFVDVPDGAANEATIAALRQCGAVNAAYTKPADEAP
ncbi:MAG: hypothetical protein IPJ62_17485 [Betaproteobacteria bacterium]|nr:hypothetical protein [Betaproteobacteria bacterium]